MSSSQFLEQGIEFQRICPCCRVRLDTATAALIRIDRGPSYTVLVCCVDCLTDSRQSGRLARTAARFRLIIASYA